MEACVLALINGLGAFLVDAAIIHGYTLLLPLRRKRLYYAVCLTLGGATGLFRDAAPWLPALDVVALMGSPFALYKGPFRHRLLAVALGIMPGLTGEVMLAATWIALTGTPSASAASVAEYPLVMAVFRIFDAGFVLAGAGLAAAFLRRFRDEGEPRLPMLRFLPLPLVQAAMLGALTYFQMHKMNASGALSWGTFGIAVMFLLVDVLVMRAMRQGMDSARMQARSEAMRGRLDGYLAQHEETMAIAGAAARVRHDARNHAQVLASLLDRGEEAEALRYARACAQDAAAERRGLGGAGGVRDGVRDGTGACAADASGGPGAEETGGERP